MEILNFKKVTIGYSDKVVYKDISFSLEEHSILCIFGENGAGKSTLLKTLLGLNKPLKGSITFGKGVDKNIGYLPQVSEMQKDFPATVREVVMSGFIGKMGFRLFFKKNEKDKAQSIMDRVGIGEISKRSFRELSGGQQQRVLLARALCATGDIIVLDEPTNGLDAKFIRSFYTIINELHNMGKTIIMVTHNLDKGMEIATHILSLRKDTYFFGLVEDYKRVSYEMTGGNV